MKNFNHFKIINCAFVVGAVAFLASCNNEPKEEEVVAQPEPVAEPAPVSARPAAWGYAGNEGPTSWSTLDPVYAICGSGQNQSPVNIVMSKVKGDNNWNFDYKTTSLRIAHNEHMDDILDNGHTIQVTVDEGSTFEFAGKKYSLKQFHFHTPSEHTIDGKNLPMEMHLVHQSDDKSLAVVSVLFEEGKTPNENMAKIIANLPTAKGESKHITDVTLELHAHLPKNNEAYHYVGSLTTPPCSENVQWLILRNYVSVSKDQVEAISKLIGPNNRPTQELHGRTVDAGDLVGQTK